MTRKERLLTNILRSKGVAVIISLVALWMAWQALLSGKVSFWPGGNSVVFPSPSEWFSIFPELSFMINAAGLICVGAMMIVINRRYNLLRTMSVFFAAFFMLCTCAMPGVACQFSSSVLLALVVVTCIRLMFSIYAHRVSSRRVFLIFTLLSAGATVDYGFLLYIPVFIIALGQMKLFKFKKLLAMILGIITPPWIVYGLGLAPWPEMPRVFWTPPTEAFTLPGGLPMLITVGFTLLTGFLLGMVNLIKIIGFNARSRAFNGMLVMVSAFTGVFAIVNFTHLYFYVTLLNACVAFQVGLFFRYVASQRGYILMLFLLASYACLYVWQIYF
ncbi:MAG: hypothetical protein NC339_06605 [Muribaculaceae bacterium]|nr:hypothetical protein [Muribaculaceae bacterium]